MPLHALRIGPDIQFEPLVNLKYIPQGLEKTEIVTFKNEGRLVGHVRLQEEGRAKTSMILEPSSFSLEPNQVQKVRIGMTADVPETIVKHV